MPVFILGAALLEEDLAIMKWHAREQRDWPYENMSKPVFLRFDLLLYVVPPAAILAALVVIVTREIKLLNADPGTAQTVLLGLGGGQLAFLTFVLSSTLIGVQFLANSYSWRAAELVLRRPLMIVGCVFVLLSALGDLALVVRSDDLLAGAPGAAIHSTAFDLAIFGSLLSSATLVGALITLGPMFTAQALMVAALSRVRRDWVTSVRIDWRRLRVLPASDSFLPAVDILYRLVERGDATGFRICVSQVGGFVKQVWPTGESPLSIAGYGMPGQPREDNAQTWPAGDRIEAAQSVDNYLWWRLRGLVRRTAEYHDPEYLEILYEMVRDLYEQCHPYVSGDETPLWLPSQVPIGERLLREIAASAIRGGKGDVAASSLGAVAFACERLVKALPPLATARLATPLDEEPPQMTEQERERQRHADDQLDVVRSGYLEYLQRSGKSAVDAKSVEAVSGALLSLSGIASAATRAAVPVDMRDWVVDWALSEFIDLVHHVLQNKLRVLIWSPVDDVAVRVEEPANDDDKKFLSRLVRHQTELLRMVRSASKLDSLSVHASAVVLWKALRAEAEGIDNMLREVGLIAVSSEDLSDGRYPEYPREEARKLLKEVDGWAGRRGDAALKNLCFGFITLWEVSAGGAGGPRS